MAYIDEDKQKTEQEQSQGGPQLQASGQPSAVSAGQPAGPSNNSSIVGNGTSTAGVGAGGTGGWTNIQSYMSANKDNTGSADALNQKVGGQFETEKTQIADQANKVKSEAQKAADSVTQAQQNASSWIQDAAKGYDYGGNHKASYTDNVGKLQSALYGDFSGPRAFTYGLSDQTQRYGQNLGNTDAFNQMMGDMYQEKAGGKLSSGGRALQTQLDVNNEALATSRQKLLQDYAGLGTLRDQTVTDTSKALSDAEQQYRVNQNSLKDYLGNQANSLDSKIGQLESDARYAYTNDYKTGKSGMSSLGYANEGVSLDSQERNANIFGDNLTWETLQNANNFYDNKTKTAESFRNNYGSQMDRLNQTLNDWYTQQDQKYDNTADAEERQWNTIQDLLKSNATRKQQGFKVRG